MHSFGQLKFFGHKNLIETWQNANKWINYYYYYILYLFIYLFIPLGGVVPPVWIGPKHVNTFQTIGSLSGAIFNNGLSFSLPL